MKVTFLYPNLGPSGICVKIEDDLPDEMTQALRKAMFLQLETLSSNSHLLTVTPNPVIENTSAAEEFVPPTEKQMFALDCATRRANTTLAEVCAEHGFNPAHFSKREALIMTTGLNEKTGFNKEQAERRKNRGRITDTRNLPDDSDIFE